MAMICVLLSTSLRVFRCAVALNSTVTARQTAALTQLGHSRIPDLTDGASCCEQNRRPNVLFRFVVAVVPFVLPIVFLLLFSQAEAAQGDKVPKYFYYPPDGVLFLTEKDACMSTPSFASGWWIYEEPQPDGSSGLCLGGPTSLGVQNGYTPGTHYDWAAVAQTCPQGYSAVYVAGGSGYCLRQSSTPQTVPEKNQGSCCKGATQAGNPVNPGVANKVQVETDYRSPSLPLEFTRTYNSWRGATRPLYRWQSTYDRSVTFEQSGYPGAIVFRPDGKILYFDIVGTQFVPDADVDGKLQRFVDASGNTTGWQYTTSTDDVELYNALGELTSITSRSGVIQTLVYSDSQTPFQTAPTPDLLLSVTDSFGHQLRFTYDTGSRLHTMTDPGSGVYTYNYDTANNLISVNYPDSSIRTYAYNETIYTSGANLPSAMTGIIDESNKRFATYQYDGLGRAISTEHAGGVGKVSFGYTTDTSGNIISSDVTDALNTTRTYSFANVLGVIRARVYPSPVLIAVPALQQATTPMEMLLE